jgi:uncharacterized protein YbbC (DUF1343 family)
MKLKHLSNILVILIVLFLTVRIDAQIINGADLLFSENLNLIKGKSVAVVCNHSSLLSNGTHLVDSLLSLKDVKVIVTFTPEHGFKGDEEAGKNIDYKNDLYKEVPIVSLYGKDKKPSNEILKDVDVLIFDIQDVGARFYTYISTLYFVIEAAGENNIPIIILDRPNPIGGNYVDGPILDPNLKSFVGIAQLPITYGMTVGELANYFIGEKIIATSKKISLEVIKIKNWNREIPTEFTSKWNSPSPNMNSLETALVYPGICLLEGTNISEGRGTRFPFLQFGAPFIKADDVIDKLNIFKIEGAQFESVSFTPEDIESMATNPKFRNTTCYGIKLKITDPEKFESVKFGTKLLFVLVKLYGNKIKFNNSFDKLAGTDQLRKDLIQKIAPDKIIASWQKDLIKFEKKRKKYLLY